MGTTELLIEKAPISENRAVSGVDTILKLPNCSGHRLPSTGPTVERVEEPNFPGVDDCTPAFIRHLLRSKPNSASSRSASHMLTPRWPSQIHPVSQRNFFLRITAPSPSLSFFFVSLLTFFTNPPPLTSSPSPLPSFSFRPKLCVVTTGLRSVMSRQ